MVVGFLFGFAANHPTDEATAWFTAIAAGLAAMALGAACMTVYYAYPAYRDLMIEHAQKPKMSLALQVVRMSSPVDEFTDTKMDERVMVSGSPFEVRVQIHNSGNAVFRWAILNIQVPVECSIIPAAADAQKQHYLSGSVGFSEDLAEGTSVPCRFTVAERDFPPVHHFLYHAVVTFDPARKEWPIAAVLESHQGERLCRRAVIQVP